VNDTRMLADAGVERFGKAAAAPITLYGRNPTSGARSRPGDRGVLRRDGDNLDFGDSASTPEQHCGLTGGLPTR